MAKRIAVQFSGAILIAAGLFFLLLLVFGAVRAFASPPSSPLADSTAAQIIVSEKPSEKAEVVLPELLTVDDTPTLPNDQFVVKRILQIDEPFVHGYYKWDDKGVPAGEIIITVDLKAESLSVFRGGYEIGATVIKFGDAIKPTPTGVFPITQKSKDHISNIYHVPMPYMLRLTNDGIAIHAADVKWGYGTRGCIGVPNEFARLLFEQVKLGDRVIVTDGKTLDLGEAIVAG